jgi:formylglycine-generating enzyme
MLRRHCLLFNLLVALTASCSALSISTICRAAITIDTVPIGDPGNANDPLTGSLYGGVAYNYRIGKYDVTVGQYAAFLNAVAATDTYGLFDPSMASDPYIAGIAQNCAGGNCSYSVIGSANHPITVVSWGDAARFANWVQNGQPIGAEGPATTETGAYTLNGAITLASLGTILRNAGAKWFIPTENEWYKAAYYDPVAAHYWSYATGTNTAPTSAPPGTTPNTVNCYSTTGFAVTGKIDLSDGQNYLTDVGAYTASASPYGTFDQSGLVSQWNEALSSSSTRGLRGGSWDAAPNALLSRDRLDIDPTLSFASLGFRVATIPEPSTAVLAVAACGLIVLCRKRFVAQV